ncbi:hypothetical protein [Bacillus sp. JJ722]|uniref:hypothetical protein n=1 Tax=Bacillus sp. JJ722 TaxID=3122973 RepID=UPI00300087BA
MSLAVLDVVAVDVVMNLAVLDVVAVDVVVAALGSNSTSCFINKKECLLKDHSLGPPYYHLIYIT